ncbi:MAG TPA: diacylglycerol kinase family protein [Thermoanaerobaculia bacterium]|nr:diacylglycerol kinase family protein [Thermoanaerobaculia bacterium]
MSGPRIVFIANPAAGKGRARREERRLRSALERAGLFGDWRVTSAPDDGIALAEESVRDGAEMVVAVGGDGTVNEVVGGLMRVQKEKRPLFGLVPAGTGNDYARVLGLKPWDVAGAATALLSRCERSLDAGEVNGRFFANGFGLGFDGSVAEAAARIHWLRGHPAYLAAVFTALTRWENFRLEAEIDGEYLEGRSILAAVTIGPASGGGFHLTPDAKPDDGLFDVCRLGDFGKLEAVRHLPKALNGSHVTLAKASMRRGRAVTLSSDRPLVAHVDGNLMRDVGHAEPLRFRIHPAALRVVGNWRSGTAGNGAQGRN